MAGLIQFMFGFIIIMFMIIIAIYIVQGIFLNKLNKLMYGKGTAMAWIPIANTYLLGKLTVNKIVGWVLVACMFLTSTFTTTINGVEKSYTILPESISSIISPLYSLAVIGLLIYAIVKYNKLKNENQINARQNNSLNTSNVNNENVSSLNTQTQYNNINSNNSLNSVKTNTNIVSQEINQNMQNNVCTNCGSMLLPNALFCTNCGKKI